MRIIIALAATCLIATAARAQSATSVSATVTDYGTYTAVDSSVMPDEQGVKDHLQINVRFTERTRIVPLRLGVSFGFQYVLSGIDEYAATPVRQITIYPTGGVVVPDKGRIYRTEMKVTLGSGDIGLAGYNIEDPWELAPGDWTLEVWTGDRLLASETFTLVAP
jgi:hypothetical protein